MAWRTLVTHWRVPGGAPRSAAGRHGASSTATVTLGAPPAAEFAGLTLWGEPGRTEAPMTEKDPVAALRVALRELAEAARSGRTGHPCDVRSGRDVVHVIAEAGRQLAARRGSRRDQRR